MGISALGGAAGLSTERVSRLGSLMGRSADSGAAGLIDGALLSTLCLLVGFVIPILRTGNL